jgi:FkbM family methyltransferase
MDIKLPPTATRRWLHIDGQDGRDQVARVASADWSAFERPLPAILHACASHFPGLVIDVGANSGYYALLAAVSGRTTGVLAFEPDASVAALLCANVAANRLQSRIAISSLALSERTGQSLLYVPTQEHGLIETSSSLEPAFKPAHSEIRAVETITLDVFSRRFPIGFRKVSLIKIDVEGHEAAVLRGSTLLIRRCRPIIFIEVLPGANTAALSGFIADNGYADMPLGAGEDRVLHEVRSFPEAWNHAFVPKERLAAFRSLLCATSPAKSSS